MGWKTEMIIILMIILHDYNCVCLTNKIQRKLVDGNFIPHLSPMVPIILCK